MIIINNEKTNNQITLFLSLLVLTGLFFLMYAISPILFGVNILPHLLALFSGFIVYKNKISKNLSNVWFSLILLFLILKIFGSLFAHSIGFPTVGASAFSYILITFVFVSLFYMIEKDDKYYRLITWVVCAAIMGALFSPNNIINTLSICGIFFLILYKIYINDIKCEKISDFFKYAYDVFIVLIIDNMIVAIWMLIFYGFTDFGENYLYFILLVISFLFVEKKINRYYAFLCLLVIFGGLFIPKSFIFHFSKGLISFNIEIKSVYNNIVLAMLSQIGLLLYIIRIMIKKGQGPSSEDKIEVEP